MIPLSFNLYLPRVQIQTIARILFIVSTKYEASLHLPRVDILGKMQMLNINIFLFSRNSGYDWQTVSSYMHCNALKQVMKDLTKSASTRNNAQ